jgi:alkylation response protein AidB-like acyl-CoA dehydrogenase
VTVDGHGRLTARDLWERADRIAEDVLFPAAGAVDRGDRVPAGHLDRLAEAGLYAMAAPPQVGGLGPDDLAGAGAVVETLAGGCLATTFVWLQHHTAVRAAAASDRDGVRATWLYPLARGDRRAGIALAGLRSPTSPLRVRAVDGGFRLDGQAPWVTGWDLIDVIYVAARDADDLVHFLLVDAAATPTLRVRPLELVAVQASRTVNLTFDDHLVPAERLLASVPFDDWSREDASGSALNGFLALGVAHRCLALLDGSTDDALAAELSACRAALVAAGVADTPAARAAGSQLAWRAAARLAVSTGSRAVLLDHPAQRLLREAAFLLVFGSRPAIRDELLAGLR